MRTATVIGYLSVTALAVLDVGLGQTWAGNLFTALSALHMSTGLIAMVMLAVDDSLLYLDRPWWVAYGYRLSMTVSLLLSAGAAWWPTTVLLGLGVLFWAIARELHDRDPEEETSHP